jgi:hypothetical protein
MVLSRGGGRGRCADSKRRSFRRRLPRFGTTGPGPPGPELLLAYVGYRGGVDTLLSALDADRDLFGAEVALSRIQLNELPGGVLLYKALGGDWR